MIEELSEISAMNSGITIEAYYASLEEQGTTPYAAQKLLADTMGISLEELLTYEKASGDLTDEQKENNENIAAALDEIDGLDILEAGDAEVAEALLGLRTNKTGEIIEVTGDERELLIYKAKEITSEYDDEYSTAIAYYTKATMDETTNYFEELFYPTKGYYFLAADAQSGAYVTGTLNGMLVTISIEDLEEGILVTYYSDKTTKE